jgi:hypothetical protein
LAWTDGCEAGLLDIVDRWLASPPTAESFAHFEEEFETFYSDGAK